MLVDLDHLLADPIFKADRCSIGFHYLHTFEVIPTYFILLFLSKPMNIIGIGLVLHMLTDLIDCMYMYATCTACQISAPAYGLMKAIANLLSI